MASNPSRYLENSTGSDPLDQALTVYSGVFAEAWRTQPSLFNNNGGLIHKRSQSGAKAYKIHHMAESGRAQDQYNPGTETSGQAYAVTDTNITVEPYIYVQFDVRRDDMIISHYDIMPRLASEASRQLMLALDRRIVNLACQAARAANVTKNGLVVHRGGNTITRQGATSSGSALNISTPYPRSATGAANFRADLKQLALNQDIDGCPRTGRMTILRHELLDVLTFDPSATTSVSTLFSRDYGTGNDINRRNVTIVEGYDIMMGVNGDSISDGIMPDTNVTSASGLPSKYHANFTPGASTGTPVALCLSRGPSGDAAVSCGIWEGPFTETWYDEDTMTYKIRTAVLPGMGILSPYCAASIEVRT